MHNAEVVIARNSLLTSCSRLFQEIGPWSLPVVPVARSQRQDSISSGGGSEHYIQELDPIIPSADAEAFVSITTGLLHVIRDLEESERRGAPTIVGSSRQTTSSTVWLAYYRMLENRVADFVQRWDAITPTAIRNSARLTRIHQEEAIDKVLHVVRSNNFGQFNELHFDWENHRHPVLASARVDPQSAYLPLDVPRSSLHMEHARGASGVIHQSRTPKLCTYEEIELTYYRNEEALEAKRRQLAQRSTTAKILPLGYMKGALEKRLATGLTVPVEPLPLEPMSAETPKSQEGCTVTQRLHDAHGRETIPHGRPDRQISEPPNEAGNQRRRSALNVNKPLPPTPSDMSVCTTPEEEAESATPQREHSTRVLNRSEADLDATDRPLSSTTVLNRSKSAAPEVRRRNSTWFRDHRERERVNRRRRRGSTDETASTADTVTQRSVSSIPMRVDRSNSLATPTRRRVSLNADSRTPNSLGAQGSNRVGGSLRVATSRRASRTDHGGRENVTPSENGRRLEGTRRAHKHDDWKGDLRRPVSRRSSLQTSGHGYASPGTIRTRISIKVEPSSLILEYEYQGLEDDAETKKARLRAKAERLGARTSSQQVQAVTERKRPPVACHCCCCCSCCSGTVSSACR